MYLTGFSLYHVHSFSFGRQTADFGDLVIILKVTVKPMQINWQGFACQREESLWKFEPRLRWALAPAVIHILSNSQSEACPSLSVSRSGAHCLLGDAGGDPGSGSAPLSLSLFISSSAKRKW